MAQCYHSPAMETRRAFLAHTLGASVTLALTAAREQSALAAQAVDAGAVQRLRVSLKGRLIMSGDATYDTARRIFWAHSGVDKRPSMIAQCAAPDDVARCVEFGRRHELSMAVRGGGHSFLGMGTCDDGLVIDLSPLNGISIDPARRTARAGAGVRAQELVHAAGRYALAPVLGECPGVGVAGLTLGGGVGWLSAKYGATCDNLISANLVTTDSRTIPASATSNPDLFWAIRGGGGNFGIATSLEYRLHPVPDVLAGGFSYRLRDARAVLRFYRDFMATAPDELQGLATLTPADGGTINVIVVYVGDTGAGQRVLSPLRSIATVTRDTVERRTYADTLTMPPYGEVVPTSFFAVRGAYLATLSDEAIEAALSCYAQAPAGCTIGFDHYMHGAVCRVAPDATAFELRAPGAVHVWIAPGWNAASQESAYMNWTNETGQQLQATFSGGRVYSNYQSAEGDAVTRSIFGVNHARLVAVKQKYDPANVLNRNANIRPSVP